MQVNPQMVRLLANYTETFIRYIQSSSLTTYEYAEHAWDKVEGKGNWKALPEDERLGQLMEAEKALEYSLRLADALQLLIEPGPGYLIQHPVVHVTTHEGAPEDDNDH